MICEACGGEWWVEQRLIMPAARPAAVPSVQTAAKQVAYRLVCADCGAGPEPTQTKKPAPTRRRKAVP